MQSNLISSLINSLSELKTLLEVRESELQESKKENELLELKIVDLVSSSKGYRLRCLDLEKELREKNVLLSVTMGALATKEEKLSKPKKLHSKSASSEDQESEEKTIPNTPSHLIKTLELKTDVRVGLYHESGLVFKFFNIKGTEELVCIGRLADDGSNGRIYSIYGHRTDFWRKKLYKLAEQKKIGYIFELEDAYPILGLEDRTKMNRKGLANF